MNQRGRIRKHCKSRSFGPTELRSGTAEIALGCRLQPHCIPPERGVSGIEGKNFIFRAAQFKTGCKNCLNDFFAQASLWQRSRPSFSRRRGPAETNHLHSDGAATAYCVSGPKILRSRPDNCREINTVMGVETSVLKLSETKRVTARE